MLDCDPMQPLTHYGSCWRRVKPRDVEKTNTLEKHDPTCCMKPLSPTTWATNFGSHQLCPNLSTAGWKIKVRDHNSLSSQLENQGDPSYFKSPSSQSLSYWNCVYFLMVTMSTVGYGDIVCVTAMGRGFQVLFLLVGLVSIYRKQTKTILRREGLFMIIVH